MIWRRVKDLDPLNFGRLKVPSIENEALKDNILSSLHPMDENLRRHEQNFYSDK